jgi:phospholipid/cholesterol/gamma-HCH transport system substrate-binding protein
MDDRVLRLRVGVVVLAAAMITAFLVARFGDLPLFGASTYTVYVRFPRAPGVTEGTPVRMSGVQIGRVIRLELLKPTGVRVVTEIDRGRTVLDSDACWITSASVLGDSVLEFVPPDPTVPDARPIEDGTEIINGRVASNPLEVLTDLQPNLEGAMNSVRNAGSEVARAAYSVNTAVVNISDQFPRVAQKAERALDQFGNAMININGIMDDPKVREDLREALKGLPQTLRNADSMLNKANSAFDSMRQATDRATLNLDNLANFTKPLGERGPQIVDNLDGTLANVNELMEQLVTFTDNLNSREGTLGRILNDDQIYLRLERTLANAEDITAGLKPIVGDFRILSDKLARDPSQILKLRSLLDRRPPGVGTKGTPTTGGAHWGYDETPIIVDGHNADAVWVP